ncbi:hypothetical protein HMPREF0682_2164 [Propionibacterium acidifaciens F0233]|uniref:Uncharacterized protein n=1 Tax=Propionibacterium acidifaciens F0233 TaxID=553198 RepID=U2RMI6_9ACTN|nr:hypothetical protein HMPREF0682_2164 [Propionibacterium acidifaciens F0233]
MRARGDGRPCGEGDGSSPPGHARARPGSPIDPRARQAGGADDGGPIGSALRNNRGPETVEPGGLNEMS